MVRLLFCLLFLQCCSPCREEIPQGEYCAVDGAAWVAVVVKSAEGIDVTIVYDLAAANRTTLYLGELLQEGCNHWVSYTSSAKLRGKNLEITYQGNSKRYKPCTIEDILE